MEEEGHTTGSRGIDASGNKEAPPVGTQHSPTLSAPPAAATAKQLQEVAGRMSAFEQSTIRWARAAVLVSALAVGFVCLQWLVMREGGADTHDLAVAAANQAAATKDLADRMKDQAGSTKTIADQAIIQARANEKLAQNAADTLANDRQAFRDEQRAWIGVRETVGKPFTETSPWNVQVTFFNSGRTPARHVQIAALFTTSNVPLSGPSADQIRLLTFHRAQSIAPQGQYHANFGTSVPAEALSIVQMQGQKQLADQYSLIKNGHLLLYYFGVVRYDDGFGNQKWTRFCIMLANPQTGEAGYCDRFNDLD
jgi:hypothetical protein